MNCECSDCFGQRDELIFQHSDLNLGIFRKSRDNVFNETLRAERIYTGKVAEAINSTESDVKILCEFPDFPRSLKNRDFDGEVEQEDEANEIDEAPAKRAHNEADGNDGDGNGAGTDGEDHTDQMGEEDEDDSGDGSGDDEDQEDKKDDAGDDSDENDETEDNEFADTEQMDT